MKTLLRIFTLALIASLYACSMLGTSTSNKDIIFASEVDPKVNFKGYTTYNWIGSASIMNDPTQQWKAPGFDANAEIKFLIDLELRAKGMSESSEKPDVLVGYALGINMTNIEYKTNPDKSFKTLEAAPLGALVIMMVDANTGVIIWASSAKADIQGNTGEAAKERLKYVINSMIGSLPK